MGKHKKVLVTGCAGFIGSHVVERLLKMGYQVVGIDNFDPFYSRKIKEHNLRWARSQSGFIFHEVDITDTRALSEIDFSGIDILVHLAAKAGVRGSIMDPASYLKVNVQGTLNMLEIAREYQILQFIYASSSSVYGLNENIPWKEDDLDLQPISPYASSKIGGEALGRSYTHLCGIRFIALRFFTVYGPRQRPDLAIHKFTRTILEGEPLTMYGDGNTRRDYTYIDEVLDGIIGSINLQGPLYEIINIGSRNPVKLIDLIRLIESKLNCRAIIHQLEEQPGDVPITYANLEKAEQLLGFAEITSLDFGIQAFVDWYDQFSASGETI